MVEKKSSSLVQILRNLRYCPQGPFVFMVQGVLRYSVGTGECQLGFHISFVCIYVVNDLSRLVETLMYEIHLMENYV